jgi:UDP-N-acetylmuramyl pentapeptide phosphotransferase/UDP-N-acetylglucosamine-1-phosphate transferase
MPPRLARPRMRGVLLIGVVTVTSLLSLTWLQSSARSVLLPLATLLLAGAVGIADDRACVWGGGSVPVHRPASP